MRKRRTLIRLLTSPVLRVVVPGALAVTIATASAYAYTAIATPQPAAPAPRTVIHHTVATTEPTNKPTVTPAPVVQLPTIPAVMAAPPKTTVATPPPVVVPAPTSSVNNLVPTTTPAVTPPADTSAPSVTSSSPTPSIPTPNPTVYSSTNWSGYLATGGTYTTVAASWTAPNAMANGFTTSADATWIGIGGVTSGDLIQVGTDNTVDTTGHVSTEAFYELLPDYSHTVPGLTVTAGDAITASITEQSAGQWLINIADTTTGQSYTNILAYTSSHSSAEWIEEDPSYSSNQLVPLDHFSPVSFTDTSTIDAGTPKSLLTGQAAKIVLVSRGGRPLSTPSVIVSDGASFTVTHN